MAQELWLLRHGDAETTGGRDDAGRRLTHEGEDQSRVAGRALARLGLGFAAILTSPRVRARDTARLVAKALDASVEVHGPLGGGFERGDALHALAGRGPDDRLLLVGHEPDLSELVHELSGGRCKLKKGGVAGLRVGRGHGELLVLMRPAELRAIAGA
jgi:phosphohistidine phosphatase